MTKWQKITPRRLENVLDELRKLTRTGAKDYEPIPADEARDMLAKVQSAIGDLIDAYLPYLNGETPIAKPPVKEETSEPEQTVETPKLEANPLDNPHAIAFFVNKIPKEQLIYWQSHLATRICDEFYDKEKKS